MFATSSALTKKKIAWTMMIRTVLQPVSCPSTARVARQQLLYFSLFPANDIYTYHFVYRYSMTIFLKFSVQKLFTFALVVIQITCISARVSGD